MRNLAETDNQSANKGDIEQIMYLHGYAGTKHMITHLHNVAISIQLHFNNSTLLKF